MSVVPSHGTTFHMDVLERCHGRAMTPSTCEDRMDMDMAGSCMAMSNKLSSRFPDRQMPLVEQWEISGR